MIFAVTLMPDPAEPLNVAVNHAGVGSVEVTGMKTIGAAGNQRQLPVPGAVTAEIVIGGAVGDQKFS